MIVYCSTVSVDDVQRFTVTRSILPDGHTVRGAFSHECEAVGYSQISEEDAFDLALHEAIRLGIRS